MDFGTGGLKKVNVRTASSKDARVEIRADKLDGPLMARVEIGKSSAWQTVKTEVGSASLTGVHDLFVVQEQDGAVDLDWISFE